MIRGRFPDVTLAQALAVLGWVLSQLVAFGLIDSQREQLLLSAGSTILAAAWHLADSYLRSSRAKALAQAGKL